MEAHCWIKLLGSHMSLTLIQLEERPEESSDSRRKKRTQVSRLLF